MFACLFVDFVAPKIDIFGTPLVQGTQKLILPFTLETFEQLIFSLKSNYHNNVSVSDSTKEQFSGPPQLLGRVAVLYANDRLFYVRKSA